MGQSRSRRGGRRRRGGGGANRLTLAQLRLILVGVLFAGSVAYRSLPSPVEIDADAGLAAVVEPAQAEPSDPYAESRRSRAILEAQEGPSPRVEAQRFSGPRSMTAAGPVRIVDGDTFVLAGERIRIADIDTPEVHGRCPYETALAARATARMRQLLAQGDFELHPPPSGRDEDRYGRKLRIVTRAGRSLGDVLVAEGLARTWSGRREGWCGRGRT